MKRPLPYRRVYCRNGAWYWRWLDSYGDAVGDENGPFNTEDLAWQDAEGAKR